jgi:flagellar biosynthesis/type III secretory pathway protein FliH
MKTIVILLIVAFAVGYYLGEKGDTGEKEVVYQTKTEYVNDPNSVSRSVLDSEVANAKRSSFNAGYEEGRKIGIDEGYKSGYVQGTEYGKSLILNQIDMRVQEAERTDKNVPLFRVKRE